MKKVKVKGNNIKSYARPSTNALVVKEYKTGDVITAYPSIEGWYELRPVDENGIMHTEFIEKKHTN